MTSLVVGFFAISVLSVLAKTMFARAVPSFSLPLSLVSLLAAAAVLPPRPIFLAYLVTLLYACASGEAAAVDAIYL